ncbi:hypothetical protein [Gordonia sp. (in: high G+C Gram-positive bacteria)]|uniref:antitoxin VbhA family protein n=1 Tax=Gordonia sp. (in: high G+C Gram-positive bacteria) TaxID=84139 RepID=UPI00345A41CC
MSRTTLTSAQRAERERAVGAAIHSLEMEGLTLPAESAADATDYIAGRIDAAGLVARARMRHGLA